MTTLVYCRGALAADRKRLIQRDAWCSGFEYDYKMKVSPSGKVAFAAAGDNLNSVDFDKAIDLIEGKLSVLENDPSANWELTADESKLLPKNFIAMSAKSVVTPRIDNTKKTSSLVLIENDFWVSSEYATIARVVHHYYRDNKEVSPIEMLDEIYRIIGRVSDVSSSAHDLILQSQLLPLVSVNAEEAM